MPNRSLLRFKDKLCQFSIRSALSAQASMFEVLQFVLYVLPFFSFRKRAFGFGDRPPLGSQFRVQPDELLLLRRYVFFGEDRIDWTFCDTYRAINTFGRVDREKVWTLTKAIYRAHIYAIRVTATNAGFSYNMSHKHPLRAPNLLATSSGLAPSCSTPTC
jgi:hypothetical protein